MQEKQFQVYYSNRILPLPENLALEQKNSKGLAVFHCLAYAKQWQLRSAFQNPGRVPSLKCLYQRRENVSLHSEEDDT